MFPSHDQGVDTSMCLDAVGAPEIIVALELVVSVAAESHSNTSPSTIKQIALSPKLSMDHIPGSTENSSVVNKMVCYNYQDSTPQRPIWTVGTLARTAWADSAVFGKPHALEYDADGVEGSSSSTYVQGNTDGISTYYQHETGTDQVKGGSVTAITANIISGGRIVTGKPSVFP